MDTTGPQAGARASTGGDSGGDAATFRCAKCQSSYPWAPEHVGRLAKCACGEVVKVPAQPTEGFISASKTDSSVAAPVATTPPRSAPGQRNRSPAVPSPTPSRSGGDDSHLPAFLRMPAAADPAADQLDADTEAELATTGKFGEDQIASERCDVRRDLHIPVGLLVAGAVLTFISFSTGASGSGAGAAAFATVVKLIIMSAAYLTACALAARIGGVNLGPLNSALLKIAAVSIFPAAMADLITQALGGDMAVEMLGDGAGLFTCWMLVWYLFRLEGQETVTVVTAISIVKLILFWVLAPLLAMIVVGGPPHHDLSAFDLGNGGAGSLSIDGIGGSSGGSSPLAHTGGD